MLTRLRGEHLPELRDGPEEERPVELEHGRGLAVRCVGLHLSRGGDPLRGLPREVERGHDNAGEDGDSEVGRHGDDRHQCDHEGVRLGHLGQPLEGRLVEDVDHEHPHGAHEGGERDPLDHGAPRHHGHREEERAAQPAQPLSAPRVDVDHGLSDHGAPAHPAEEPCGDVADTLGDALHVGGARPFLGDLVHELLGQQCLDEADHGDSKRGGRDGCQGPQAQRNLRKVERGQRPRDGRHVPNGPGRDATDVDGRGERQYGGQGGGNLTEPWNSLGGARPDLDDGHGERGEAGHDVQLGTAHPSVPSRRGRYLELLELADPNHDGQAVHEAHHHGLRHQANELPEPQGAEDQLDQTREHDGCEEVLNTELGAERGENHGRGPRRAGDDPVLRAEDRGEEGHGGRSVEPHDGRHAGHEGEGQ